MDKLERIFIFDSSKELKILNIPAKFFMEK